MTPRPAKSKPFPFPIAAVDLFCGAGGLTRGLLDAGIPVVAGYDIEEACKYAYEHNNAPATLRKRASPISMESSLPRHYPENYARILGRMCPLRPIFAVSAGAECTRGCEVGSLGRICAHRSRAGAGYRQHGERPRPSASQYFPRFSQDAGKTRDFTFARKRKTRSFIVRITVFRSIGVVSFLVASKFGPIKLIRPTHKPSRLPERLAGHRQTSRSRFRGDFR